VKKLRETRSRWGFARVYKVRGYAKAE